MQRGYQGMNTDIAAWESDLRRIAARHHIPVADVRQQAWLVAREAQDTWDPARGSYRQWCLGRLWGWAKRQGPCGVSLDTTLVDVLGSDAGDPVSATVEDIERRITDAAVRRRVEALPPELRIVATLIARGHPIERVAALMGLTPRAVHYRIDRSVRILKEGQVPAAEDPCVF